MTPHHRDEGFTLLELIIALAVLAVIVSIAYPVLATGTQSYGAGAKRSDLDRNVNRVIDEIAAHLSLAGASTVYPDTPGLTWSSYVIYYENEGYVSGSIQWSQPRIIYWRYSSSEPNDGKDNDGDGMVDEGEVVRWTYGASGSPEIVILATNVPEYLEGETPNGLDDNGNGLIDERGLCFSRSGEVWTIRLSLQRSGGDDRSLIQTVETAVTPRNQ